MHAVTRQSLVSVWHLGQTQLVKVYPEGELLVGEEEVVDALLAAVEGEVVHLSNLPWDCLLLR